MAESSSDWTFLTNHSHVLFCLAMDPEIRLRDVADRVGITERAVQRIVTELEDSGYIKRQRQGRRNTYEVHQHRPLRHQIESHRNVSDLLKLILEITDDPKDKPVGRGSSSADTGCHAHDRVVSGGHRYMAMQ